MRSVDVYSLLFIYILGVLIVSCIMGCEDKPAPADGDAIGNYYAECEIKKDYVVGLQAIILNHYGTLSGEGEFDFECFSWVYGSIFKEVDGVEMWAQAGIGKFRRDSCLYISKGFRCEVRGTDMNDNILWYWRTTFDGIEPPPPPEDSEYCMIVVELNTDWTEWRFDLNDTTFIIGPMYSWQTSGTHMEYAGEVTHFANHMPGRYPDAVFLEDLECSTVVDNEYMRIEKDDIVKMHSDREEYWGIDASFDYRYIERIFVWDKRDTVAYKSN